MDLVVQKYGGSSLKSPKHIRSAALRIKELKGSGVGVVVVVSAMGHSTDHLIKLARRTVNRPPLRELDMLLTAGERVSMSLLAMALQDIGVAAISFTGSQSGIITSNEHTEAKIIEVRAKRIREELDKGKVAIIAGFQGVSVEKEITTLGRGGSDTTAVAISASLGATRCEVLTDVEGLFSADPRLVGNAVRLTGCTYDEALELSSLGAKMQARSIGLAKKFGVKIWITSSQNTDLKGTMISENTERETMEKTEIRGITTKDGFHFFRAQAKVGEVLGMLQEQRVAVRFFNFAETSISFLCEEEKAVTVKETLAKSQIQFVELPKISIVSAVGDGVLNCPDVLPLFAQTLGELKTECLLLSSNSLSITAAIPEKDKKKIAEVLHERLIEKR